VTSTPLKDKISDLKPLLAFLRVNTGSSNLQRLLEETASFKRLFGEIGARTLKSQITHEMTLPDQVRYIVPVELTAIEKVRLSPFPLFLAPLTNDFFSQTVLLRHQRH
jgi:hypothetical protein